MDDFGLIFDYRDLDNLSYKGYNLHYSAKKSRKHKQILTWTKLVFSLAQSMVFAENIVQYKQTGIEWRF